MLRNMINKSHKKTFIHMPDYSCYLILDDIKRLSRDNNGPYILLNGSDMRYYIKDSYYKAIEKLIRDNNKIIEI